MVGRPAPRILDVGGGDGSLAERMVKLAGAEARATVVDLDPASVEEARRRGLQGFAGPFERFETDDRFEIVLMLNLLEHLSDPVAALEKARDLLAPRGIIWLQTPNFRALDARLFRHRNWAGLHCPRHFVVFSAEGLLAVLERSRLAPVRFEHTQAGSFWAASILGLARRNRRASDHRDRPLVENPAYLPLAGAGAALDFATRRFRATSQVVAFARAC